MFLFKSQKYSLTALLWLITSLLACAQDQANMPTVQDYDNYEGTYELNPGHRITMGIFDELGGKLAWLDLKDLSCGVLEPVSAAEFKTEGTKNFTVRFVNSSKKGKGLEYREGEKTTFAPQVNAHYKNPVSFSAGTGDKQRTLKGNLYLPVKKGRHPVVVFAHGAGAATRNVAFFTTFFLSQGIGVLTFDKQGAGESTGNWEVAGYDELAEDVIAGIEMLKRNNHVNPGKIGVHGSSQGGWIGAMVAARQPDLAFLIVRAGAGISVADNMIREYKGLLLKDGWTEEQDLEEALGLLRQVLYLAGNKATWEQSDSLVQSYKDKPWFGRLYPTPRLKNAALWEWWQKNAFYNSVPYLEKVSKTPVLWLLAAEDWNVDSQASQPAILQALKTAGNPDYQVAMLPKANHGFMVSQTGSPADPMILRYVPGYWEEMAKWLKKRGISK